MLKTSSDGRSGPTALGTLERRLAGGVPEASAVPRPLLKAVRCMLGGAAVTVLLVLFAIVLAIVDRNAFTNPNGTKISTGQFTNLIVFYLVVGVIVAGLWIMMARLNRAGLGWARIAASALCAVFSFGIYRLISSFGNDTYVSVAYIISLVLVVAMWVLGVVALALLWRAQSSAYYKARTAAR